MDTILTRKLHTFTRGVVVDFCQGALQAIDSPQCLRKYIVETHSSSTLSQESDCKYRCSTTEETLGDQSG